MDRSPKKQKTGRGNPKLSNPAKAPSLPPSDAIVLYSGAEDLDKWTSDKGGPVDWNAGEILTVQPKSKGIKTVQSFGSVQLHIEWRSPEIVEGKGQGRGNSGIHLIGKPKYKSHPDKLPLMLQEHNNPVSYRNIWVREL